ncbi:MAG: hypothetical protein BIFFINMI_03822 [Phycisphaerae bacterium]|nr:hypothetical protein [Phycisphaerae bacterium]
MNDAFAEPGTKIDLVPCGSTAKHSFFFHLVEPEWRGNKPLHRLCSLMRKMRAQCYTVERLAANAEIAEEHDAAAVRCNAPVVTTATRFTFFRTCPKSNDWHALEPQDILAYAVLLRQDLPDGKSRFFILESVARPPAIFVEGGMQNVSNYYPHCVRDFPTIIGHSADHRQFSIRGSFFCQQNDLTHVCAHAALRMAMNSSPTLALPDKLTNGRINALLGIDHHDGVVPPTGRSRRVGHYNGDNCGGLTDPEIVDVIGKLGRSSHYANFADRPGVEYAAYIYPLVESQLPVILAIDRPGVSHVVTVLGHTLNTDRWEPEARLGYGAFPISKHGSSAAWADHFVISDDNFGMYVTLPSDMIRNFLVPEHNPNLHASSAIGIIPAGLSEIPAYLVEAFAAKAVEAVIVGTTPTPDNQWLTYLREPLAQGDTRPRSLVCRTVLVEKKARYVDQFRDGDNKGNLLPEDVKTRLLNLLPDRFWLTEITLPDLYTANKHKLGDLITKADSTVDQFLAGDARIFCWLPGLARWGAGLPDPQEPWPLMGHVPLFRHGDGPLPLLEW